MSYLRQGASELVASVEIVACSTVPLGGELLREVRDLEQRLSIPDPDQNLLNQYAEALTRLESSGAQHILDHLDEALRCWI